MTVKLGITLLAISFVGLFLEYVWREAAGRLTPSMRRFYMLLILPAMAGAFFVTDYFGWGAALRFVTGIVGGFVFWLVAYAICGVLYMLVVQRFHR